MGSKTFGPKENEERENEKHERQDVNKFIDPHELVRLLGDNDRLYCL
jgi:hypothetical protein